jgi:D-arabinose 1-dehydrogenase-like Zn-dependent alcohol dehydrogenase
MKIQAAVAWEAGAELSIEEFDLDDPRDDEILVKIEAVGVCHTDDNARLGRLPVIVTERNIVPVPADAPLRYLAGFTCGVQTYSSPGCSNCTSRDVSRLTGWSGTIRSPRSTPPSPTRCRALRSSRCSRSTKGSDREHDRPGIG